jgi:hypothetical protein
MLPSAGGKWGAILTLRAGFGIWNARLVGDELVHDAHYFDTVGLIDVIVDFFAALFAYQQFRVTQDFQVMRNGWTADLEQARDIIDADFLARLEYQQNLLAGSIAEREEKAGKPLPAFGQVIGEVGVHATKCSGISKPDRIIVQVAE